MIARPIAAFAALLAVSVYSPARAAFVPLGLTSTGITPGGTGLANGTVDGRWVVSGGSVPLPIPSSGGAWNANPTVVDRDTFPQFGAWARTNYPGSSGVGSRWLTPTYDGFDFNSTDPNVFTHPGGSYWYTQSFAMPADALPGTVSIRGRYWADDFLTGIVVNGTSVFSATPDGFGQFAETGAGSGNIAFDISASALAARGIANPYTSGTNTVSFVVFNGNAASGNPNGLRVEFDVQGVETRDTPGGAAVPVPPTAIAAGLGLLGLAVRRVRRAG